MFMVLSSWHSHCDISPGSFDECRLSAGWPPTLRPNQPIWAVSPLKVGCYHPQTPLPFIIITQLVSWYSFYRPTEGGSLSRPRHCSKGAQPVPKAVYRSDCRDKHDRPQWDSNLGPLALQSSVLPLSHRDLPIGWCMHRHGPVIVHCTNSEDFLFIFFTVDKAVYSSVVKCMFAR